MTSSLREGSPTPFYPLHRPELRDDLGQGDARLSQLMEGTRKFLPPGRVIIAADQENVCVYRLRSGWRARVRHLRDGRSQILAVLLPGDLFGVRAMYLDADLDEIFAIDEVAVELIDQREAREAARRDWQVALRLNWQLVEDERRVHNWVVGIGRGSAEERLALMLFDLRGRLILSGQIDQEATEFALPMTQNQIGDLLGMTAVHVNRTMKRFRELGLARFHRGLAMLDDLPALLRLAYPMFDLYEKTQPEFAVA